MGTGHRGQTVKVEEKEEQEQEQEQEQEHKEETPLTTSVCGLFSRN
jgi:ribosomal protein L12E/L44/L45/RPP1/RPP2